jgi:hypothetical protein
MAAIEQRFVAGSLSIWIAARTAGRDAGPARGRPQRLPSDEGRMDAA